MPWCGASRVGRSPPPDSPSLGHAAGAPYPLAVSAGGAGLGSRHQSHWARSCELALRAVGAARGCSGGGRLLPGDGASGLGRSPPPNGPSLGHAAGARYPLALGAGGVGVGSRHQLHCARSCELALLAVEWHEGARGVGRRLPGCGAPGAGRSPTPDQPSLGRAAGSRYPLAVGAGGVGVGTHHRPDSARCCELALRAGGTARGRPGGGASLAVVWGVRG